MVLSHHLVRTKSRDPPEPRAIIGYLMTGSRQVRLDNLPQVCMKLSGWAGSSSFASAGFLQYAAMMFVMLSTRYTA